MRWARRARKTLFVLAISFITTTQLALAADGDPQPTTPTGFADLLPTPDLSHGDTRTLFETYSPMAYSMDFDVDVTDPVQSVFNGYAHMVMMFIVAITRGAIAVGWWLFSFTDIKPLTETATHAIGNVNLNLVGWLLPSALAFGAVVAYAQRRASGSAMSQLVWVLAAGVLATSFAAAPSTWLGGIDGARKFGSDAVVNTATDSLGGTVQSPIQWPEPSFAGPKDDVLLRKSGDAAWRAFAVTPWCVAEFGSLAACQRYGKAILDFGTDEDARFDYIDDEISKAEGGDNAATVKWAKGENPFGRVGVLTLGAIVAALFAALTVSLAFTALMAFIGCLLLLIIGMFFVCLMIIPGRPRQWGMSWIETLIGLVLQSFFAMLVFSVTLTLLTAVFSLTDSVGWLPVSGLAIALLIAGFRLRRLLESFATMMRPGAGSIAMGGMARRGAMRAVRRIMGTVNSRAASPTIPQDRSRGGAASAESPGRVSSVRVYRQAPAAGALQGGPNAVNPAHQLPGAGGRQLAGAISASGGAGPAGRRQTELAGEASRGVRTRDDVSGTRARMPSAIDGGSSATVKKTGASTVAVSSVRSAPATEASQARHARQKATSQPASGGRFESPRSHGYSASLRDGPPKRHRRVSHSSSSAARRNFRDYSSVTKDGVTVLVPKSR